MLPWNMPWTMAFIYQWVQIVETKKIELRSSYYRKLPSVLTPSSFCSLFNSSNVYWVFTMLRGQMVKEGTPSLFPWSLELMSSVNRQVAISPLLESTGSTFSCLFSLPSTEDCDVFKRESYRRALWTWAQM